MRDQWQDNCNPFNSMKALYWAEHLERFHRGHQTPPITVDVEPTNTCNLRCAWCYPQRTGARDRHPGHMDEETLLALPGMLAEWGVRGVQVTGGGEPTLHPRFFDFLVGLRDSGLSYTLITNGSAYRWPTALVDVLAEARWIGVSVDAWDEESWCESKGGTALAWLHLCENIRDLAGRTSVYFKFLLHDGNASHLWKAMALAASLGCCGFHARPAYQGLTRELPSGAPPPGIASYVVGHKFDAGALQRLRAPCTATPLLATICPDGAVYLCQDHRGEPAFRLCAARQVRSYWGFAAHRAVLEKIDPRRDCQKCTFRAYNEIFARLENLDLDYL